MPFKWNASALSGLAVLKLGSGNPTRDTRASMLAAARSTITVDRLINIIKRNPKLEVLEVGIPLAEAVLPLSGIVIPELESLSITGGRHALTLLQHLMLPSLIHLNVSIDARVDSMDEELNNVWLHSQSPALRTFKYEAGRRSGMSAIFAAAGFPITFLDKISDTLVDLKVARCGAQVLLARLVAPVLTGNVAWCPGLKSLTLEGCPPHRDVVPYLIKLIEQRNPIGDGAASSRFGSAERIDELVLKESFPLGADVLDWLKKRVSTVEYVESPPGHGTGYPYHSLLDPDYDDFL